MHNYCYDTRRCCVCVCVAYVLLNVNGKTLQRNAHCVISKINSWHEVWLGNRTGQKKNPKFSLFHFVRAKSAIRARPDCEMGYFVSLI